MMKKVFIYVGLLLAVSITSISALGPQPIACQSTASTSNAKFTADCALKTLRTKGIKHAVHLYHHRKYADWYFSGNQGKDYA